MFSLFWNVFSTAAAALVTLGALVAFGSWLFKTFGERWMENRFARNLEQFRHAQSKELETLRFEIAALLDRTSKVHQREYEVLPEVWGSLVAVTGKVRGAVSSFRQYPNVMFAEGEKLGEILLACDLSVSEVETVKDAERAKRQRTLGRILDYRQIQDVRAEYIKFHELFRRHSIFISSDLNKEIGALSDMLWAALVEAEVNLENGDTPRERAAKKALEGECQQMLDRIQGIIHGQLWQTKLP